jgi:2-polyprenyl-3-methyl-5-hydroxy-6-metoxy-1,4-benzoquinol methylase
MSECVRVTACRLCDSPDLDLVVSFTPTPPGDQYLTEARDQPCYPLDVLKCRACDAVQLADTVDPTAIYTDYLYTTSVSKGLSEHYEQYANDLACKVPRLNQAFVVDIGSNDGTLLTHLQSRFGCSVLGIDPAPITNTVPTISGYFGEDLARVIQADEQYGSAHVITANHVMANVADLHDFIKGVKHLLSPLGTFVFETGYWPAIVEKNLIDTIEHEHIHYFAVKPLRQLFRRHGLELTHVELNTAKGGSLRGYVQHVEVARVTHSVAMFIADEEYAPPLQAWVRELKGLEARMKQLIAASGDEVWVGYGAAVGSTLLLHQFGLGDKLECLIDANLQKRGRWSPGYHLPVYDPTVLAELEPDRIVILAWRYAEMIQQQHPEYAGKWILPLPDMVTA